MGRGGGSCLQTLTETALCAHLPWATRSPLNSLLRDPESPMRIAHTCAGVDCCISLVKMYPESRWSPETHAARVTTLPSEMPCTPKIELCGARNRVVRQPPSWGPLASPFPCTENHT